MRAAREKGDMGRGRWVHLGGRSEQGPSPAERAAIVAACDRFIAEVLRPRFLLEIQPTDFNYPIDIGGKWHGRNYRFFQRCRSDGQHTKKGSSTGHSQGWNIWDLIASIFRSFVTPRNGGRSTAPSR
jgi:hypothetical protein